MVQLAKLHNKVKKIFLLLSVLGFASTVQAQLVAQISGGIYGCPKEFTKNNVGVVYSIQDRMVRIYDKDFNVVKTFTCQNVDKRPTDIVEECIISGADGGCSNSSLTQTLFNNDEKWEYVTSVERNDGSWEDGYFVYSEDGTCLGKLPYEPAGIIVNDGKKYLVLEDNSNDMAYIYNMEKGMDAFKDPNAVVSVKASDMKDGKVFDLSGRRLAAPGAGRINIINGKKVVK